LREDPEVTERGLNDPHFRVPGSTFDVTHHDEEELLGLLSAPKLRACQ
jgi:hypothetical protein